MFDNEIIKIEKEIAALKAASRRAITNDSLVVKTISVTSGITQYSWNQTINLKINYASDNPPIMMICAQRESGDNLKVIVQRTWELDEVNKTMICTITPNWHVIGSVNAKAITLRLTIYALSEFDVEATVSD